MYLPLLSVHRFLWGHIPRCGTIRSQGYVISILLENTCFPKWLLIYLSTYFIWEFTFFCNEYVLYLLSERGFILISKKLTGYCHLNIYFYLVFNPLKLMWLILLTVNCNFKISLIAVSKNEWKTSNLQIPKWNDHFVYLMCSREVQNT